MFAMFVQYILLICLLSKKKSTTPEKMCKFGTVYNIDG